MIIRNANAADLPAIETIYADARQYMRDHGNLNQWVGGYPTRELLLSDLEKHQLFVVTQEDEILGVFVYFFGDDPTYAAIENGAWLNDAPYGVIHRIAVAAHRKGVASFVFDHCLGLCRNLKIDTHADNIPMRKSLLKNGFTHTGVIHIANGDPREAFQKSLL